MRMSRQPPQSSWFNVLALAMFSSMEKEVDQHDIANSVEGLINVLEEVFWNYDSSKLEREFGILAKVYKETLLVEGGKVKSSQFHDSVRYREVHGKDAVDRHLNAKMLAKYEKLNREQNIYFYEHHVNEDSASEFSASETSNA